MTRSLVEAFYSRARRDPLLGPVFEPVLAARWDEHIARLVDFWSSVTLRTGRYHGRPTAAHAGHGLTEHHFARWLEMFEASARDVCPPEAADVFVGYAHRIGESLQIGLGIGPKALDLPKAG
jgi:hemoglobin